MMRLNRYTRTSRHSGQSALAIVATLTLAVTPALAASDPSPETAAAIAEIQTLRAEQQRIAELQQQVAARLQALEAALHVAPSPSAQPVTPATPASAVAATAAAAKPRLAVSGDLRIRSQGDYASDTPDHLSGQVRGRLGVTYTANDVVSIGARLVTGNPDDPNSTDVQLSNFDDDFDVSLDQAYVQFNLGDLKLYGGKMPQPFVRTELVWDGDVNPQGVSAVYRHALSDGSAFRANGLFFIIDERAVAADSTMLGAQFGYDTRTLGKWKLDASVAYYDYKLGSVAGADSGDLRSNLLNPDGTYRSDFELGDVIIGATWNGAGERWPLRIVGDFVRNFGAATDADTGYGADFTIGRASKVHDWRVTYGYSIAETDAVLAAFSHDNIALGTNYRLHALTLDYVPFPKTMLSAIWYHYQPYESTPTLGKDWIERLRLAFAVSF
ncbi:MAG: hypothetical protein CMLOHMNK_01373 [Steroidobacteraceae bacterium]|nr:hypothetical protein [Steroidobacteraceae bacterium]